MQDTPDQQLLAQFVRENSEAAFAELVRRHIGLVHSVALRQTSNPHSAEEITQAVFIILARKAAALGPKVVLSGWLYQTARLTAANVRRSTFRRVQHEQEAYMQSTLAASTTDSVWLEMAPLLEEAMGRLGATDRDAVVLRYFENKSLADVGAALGVEERAAQKRVGRALEKMRRVLVRRGLASTTAIIAGVISAHSVQAASPELVKSVTLISLAKGGSVSASTSTLIKGTLKIMAWSKAKTGIVAGLGLLFVAGTSFFTVNKIMGHRYNERDFWATRYATSANGIDTSQVGQALNITFPISTGERCSVAGLLNQCMAMTGWTYEIEKDVAAGTVTFGPGKVMNGEEWISAFEAALQTNHPEWWDQKRKTFRKENLVLIRRPREKVILVLPRDKARKYE